MAMAPIAAGAGAPDDAPAAAQQQPWPATRVANYALFVFALSLMFGILDRSIFGLMVEWIKRDFSLSDLQLGLLLGPAGILFYVFIGIPMARLVDIYPRRIVLACGIFATSGLTAVCGLAQGYAQLFLCRMVVGVGGSAHGPGTYSMMADYFPPRRLPRAIAYLQVGNIVGAGLASIIGGLLLGYVAHWQPTAFAGLTIRNWQWVLIFIGVPGLIVAAMTWMLPEPPRRGKVVAGGKPLPFTHVLKEIHRRRGVYYPLYFGLALSSIESGGLQEWRAPFMIRTYGWTPQDIGLWQGSISFLVMPLGLALGTWLTERWTKQGRTDAPVRVTTTMFACAIPFAVLSPLMPTGELAIIFGSLSGIFGIATAVPQNAAIQTVTPNEMRGQVTAIYLFVFTVFGAMGSYVIALFNHYVIGDEQQLWKTMAITAAILMPLAAYVISRGVRPYGREVERLEREGLLDLDPKIAD